MITLPNQGLSDYSTPTTPPTYLLWPRDLMRDYITEPVLDCQMVQGVSRTYTAWIKVFSSHLAIVSQRLSTLIVFTANKK